MSWYRVGNVTSVAGTNVIIGIGTLWNNPVFGIAPGQMILVPGAGQVVIYEILSIDSDTKIRITSNSASSITNSEYAIVTTVSNSMSDLARRTAVQLALYQKLLEDWQQITTGTGQITLVAPDGTEVTISAIGDLAADVEWLQGNKDIIEGAAGFAEEARQHRDDASSSALSAKNSKDNAAASAAQAISAVNSIGTAVQDAQEAAGTATNKAAQASSDADRAEAAANTVDTEALLQAIENKMPKAGGTFTGPVILNDKGNLPLAAATAGQLTGLVGDSRNLAINLYVVSTTAAITADDLIVQSSSGIQYRTGPINTPINISISGIGGMYNTAPVAGFIAIYAIYNPTTKVTALYGLQHTQTTPEVFPYALPAGYTASALVSCWRTSASQLVAGMQIGREIKVARVSITSGSGDTSNNQIFLNNILPPNARIGIFDCSAVTSSSNNTSVSLQTTAGTIGYNRIQNGSAIAIGTIALPLNRSTTAIYVYLSASTGTPANGTWSINALGYSI